MRPNSPRWRRKVALRRATSIVFLTGDNLYDSSMVIELQADGSGGPYRGGLRLNAPARPPARMFCAYSIRR